MRACPFCLAPKAGHIAGGVLTYCRPYLLSMLGRLPITIQEQRAA